MIQDRQRFLFEMEKLYANAQEMAAKTKELAIAVENAIAIQTEARCLREDLDLISVRLGLATLQAKSGGSNGGESG